MVAQPQLARDRFPAFMDLVRAQITSDFDEQTLRKDGLSIFTTLDPAAQIYAERAVRHTWIGMGRRGRDLQAAVVVTDTHNGQVLAMVGGRDPGAARLQPCAGRPAAGRFDHQAVRVPGGAGPAGPLVAGDAARRTSRSTCASPTVRVWSPQNDDHARHGEVPLVDALVNSWNLATVHLGLAVGVDASRAFLKSFGLQGVKPNPSLLLGAIDLAPLQVAQLYQYLAANGHALPLISVRGVLDSKGRVIKRYAVRRATASTSPRRS